MENNKRIAFVRNDILFLRFQKHIQAVLKNATVNSTQLLQFKASDFENYPV